MEYNIFIIYILLTVSAILGSVLTIVLQKRYKMSSVRASALLSLIVGLACLGWAQYTLATTPQEVALVFMAASFVGMTNPALIKSYWILILSSIIVVILYLNISIYFTGYGGSLGTLANISLLVSFGAARVCNTLVKSTKNTPNKN